VGRLARTILIAAGGTGGHLFPGLSVAKVLAARGRAVVFVGTARGLETKLVRDYPLELLPVRPLNGVGVLRGLLGLLVLPWALLRAVALLRRTTPEAVLGIGGYAGGPLVLMAALLGVKTVILEPNAEPGFTNRVLRPFVGKAACAYAQGAAFFGPKGVLTGNPVREGFFARGERAGLCLLAFGGSQGSAALNRALIGALPALPRGLRIVHQTGPRFLEETRAAYRQAGVEGEVLPFLEDMERRVQEAHLVLCRSGATTCAELAAAGRASVLVPFAKAAGDHQRQNARAMEEAGAAVVVEEGALPGLGETLAGLLGSPERLRAMEGAASGLARPHAAEAVCDLLLGEGA
jgi:UDP-N-acetylglucosamine--N-acetylmuramyl-(pentapeptide) pyrophosphoryl-undecaprenol N-acetylglucosamine transferase